MSTKEEMAKILLEIKAVTLSPQKPYRWASGILSPIYCDNRLLMGYPDKWEKVIDAYIHEIQKNDINFDILGGVSTSGIPHAALIASKLKKPMIYIRDKPKEHGKQNRIEGKLETNQKVLIIEDLISTGGSSVNAVEGARESGGKVSWCIAIYQYGLEKAKKKFDEAKCNFATLTDFETTIRIAAEHGYINDKEKEIALDWSQDPEKWGRKHGFEP